MREPVHPEKINEHTKFKQYAMQLIGEITGTSQISYEATDPALRKIEKSAIVEHTSVNYSPTQLLALVHHHLQAHGLLETAKVLQAEANLSTFPPPPSANSLDNIVTQFLKDQHRRWANPIAVLPPFSLFEEHHCPVPTGKQKAPKNLANRVLFKQFNLQVDMEEGEEIKRLFSVSSKLSGHTEIRILRLLAQLS